MPRRCAANAWIRLELSGMSAHLRSYAARAENRAAQIFATDAILLGDGVLGTDALSGAVETVHAPNGKEDVTHRPQDDDVQGDIRRFIIKCHQGERHGVHRVCGNERNHHAERALGGNLRTWLSQPSQFHPRHDLCHGALRAPQGAAKMRVADAQAEAREEAVLPFARRCDDARVGRQGRHGRQELFSFRNASIRNFDGERPVGIVIDERIEGVPGRQRSRCRHGHHQRLGVFIVSCVILGVHGGGLSSTNE
mmetsp:Transcript_5026/g.14646  ORF Transcript_5026/g.14646 Transcript_5026/m.14646 type:complete len:252 (+) Transcript_5026:302-1057(+)